MAFVRGLVSKKKTRFKEDGFDLDLTYVTPRIIAMGFPSSGAEAKYRNPLPEVKRFEEKYHAGHFRVYNLCSEREYAEGTFEQMCRFPFDDHNPPPLTVIEPFCKDVDAWLAADPKNVIAVHCKAGKGRTGCMIAAYLVHSRFEIDGVPVTSELALKHFGEIRTSNGKGVTIPSQMRYVHYYEQQLLGGVRPIFTYKINHVRVHTVPKFDIGGGCDPYFQVKVNNRKVFDYRKCVKKVAAVKGSAPYIDLDVSAFNLLVRENVKVMFYDYDRSSADDKMFHFWFHTGYIDNNYLCFEQQWVDKACKDLKKNKVFKKGFCVEVFLNKVEGDVSFDEEPDDEPADSDTEDEGGD